jgi:hypothetical protein
MTPPRKLRPSPAFVLAALALMVALGGSAYAVSQIDGKTLVDRSVAGKKLKKNTVTGVEVNESKLAKVPRAANADHANNADLAKNSQKLGGNPAGKFSQQCKPGPIAAYAYVKGVSTFSSTYTSGSSVLNQFNCTGGVVQVKRTGIGVYDVHFGGLDNGSQVAAVGNLTVDSGGAQASGYLTYKLIFDATVPGTVYQVKTIATGGSPTDLEFSFALIAPVP